MVIWVDEATVLPYGFFEALIINSTYGRHRDHLMRLPQSERSSALASKLAECGMMMEDAQ